MNPSPNVIRPIDSGYVFMMAARLASGKINGRARERMKGGGFSRGSARKCCTVGRFLFKGLVNDLN